MKKNYKNGNNNRRRADKYYIIELLNLSDLIANFFRHVVYGIHQ